MKRPWPLDVSIHDTSQVPVELAKMRKAGAIRSVQFTLIPSERDLLRLNEVMARHPGVTLRFYRIPKGTDVSSLRALPSLRRLKLEFEPKDLSFLGGLSGLEALHVFAGGRMEMAPLGSLAFLGDLSVITQERTDLSVLRDSRCLRRLSLGGALKGRDFLTHLPGLESLNLCFSVKDLFFLAAMPKLRSYAMDGGSLSTLRGIEKAPALKHLRLNSVRAVPQNILEPMVSHPGLRYVQMHYLPLVKRLGFLPNSVRHLELVCLNGLESLKGLDRLRLTTLSIMGQCQKSSHWDAEVLLRISTLKRCSLAPFIGRSLHGEEVLAALKPRKMDFDSLRGEAGQSCGMERHCL